MVTLLVSVYVLELMSAAAIVVVVLPLLICTPLNEYPVLGDALNLRTVSFTLLAPLLTVLLS